MKMTANRPGVFALFAWLSPIVMGVTLVAASVAIAMQPAAASLPLMIALGGISLALALSLIQRTSYRKLSHKLYDQLEQLAAMSSDDLDPERFQQQLLKANLSDRARAILSEIYQCIDRDREKIFEFQQKSASSEVKAHLAESRASQIYWVIEGLTEPVVMVNQYGEITLMNPAAVNLFGLHEVPKGVSVEKGLNCDSLVQLLNETRRRKLKSTRLAEIELADPDGEKHWYRVTVNTVAEGEHEGAADTAFGAVAVMRDISGYKAIQRRNAEFVSAVSHEMKTPLAGIKAYTELLADGEAEDEETRDEFLGVISGQADRLQRLIDNLLNLARIEAGVVSVSKKPRSLNDLLEEAAAIVQPTAEQKQITLKVELSPMYLGVLADRDMILQSAINLLSNAIKYTPDGGNVTLRSRMSDREVHFEVEDTGVGLSPEDCEMVFEKFYRVKKDQKMASGTGLGLPLAKHIVEDVHGGNLTVKSELCKGSTFMIALPTVQVIEHAT
ncbi:sensor histidine kinase [Bremerella sp. T1]|uniref:sensor histidine kinase n=1 Tax=Bremerella sp. TYQ1 TaxID=3119568 RepID=UPI001CCCB133|nr:PAS domain-containing sensor histidine kinase [Bremerella volcania]UBM37630.1 cell wall metabolism sensor histidine kinase WalK [Bremerella volcania]